MKIVSLVSIVIPVYNGENYMRDAIDSALAQTYPNREVIVVNDGSTDRTHQIALSYGDRIRYFSKENGGVSTALNLGVEKMQGEYFTWLAHDDMFYPQKLARQMDAIEQAVDKTMIVHSNYDLLNVKQGSKAHMRQEDSYSMAQLTNSVFPLLMTTLHASTPLVHKSHFARVGLFDDTLPLTQDYDFLFRAMRGQNTAFLPECLLISRLHSQSGKNTETRFAFACCEQYKHFLDALTLHEICSMFPSTGAFYCRMAGMMRARNDASGAKEILKCILRLPKENCKSKQMQFLNRLKELAGDQSSEICIFGAGYQGRVLKFELERRKIKIACFCDNDSEKHNVLIDGTVCLSLPEISKKKEHLLIIIAADMSDVIAEQLKAAGFMHLVTKKSLDGMLLNCPPTVLQGGDLL